MTKNHTKSVPEIVYQPELCPELPVVLYGAADYHQKRALFERLDKDLKVSGIEAKFIELALNDQGRDAGRMSAKRFDRFARGCVLALRSNLARMLLRLSHREFCALLPDSHLLSHFLGIGRVEGIRAFGKSTSERFEKYVSVESLRTIHEMLINQFKEADFAEAFGLEKAVSYEALCFDNTCVKANIHFPIDWVLLRDAARTLMKAVKRIRDHGLKIRMPKDPLSFFSDMNSLCMKMSATQRKKNGKAARKAVFREMKSLVKVIAGHAHRHLQALQSRPRETDLSAGEVAQTINGMESILTQLAAVIKQAHERIIGGRLVANEDKILSLYDSSVEVILRGKAGARVEFGNPLWIVENTDGLIVDYKLNKENLPDSSQLAPSLERLSKSAGLPKSVWADRGIASKSNSALLKELGIHDGLCPKDPKILAERLETEPGFREGLKRRSGIEARIGIFKNVFLESPPRQKGFAHREIAVGWAAITHNLWVVARMANARQRTLPEQIAA